MIRYSRKSKTYKLSQSFISLADNYHNEMSENKKYAILKNLTSKELQELCKQHELRGFSGLKQKELAKFVSDNLDP